MTGKVPKTRSTYYVCPGVGVKPRSDDPIVAAAITCTAALTSSEAGSQQKFAHSDAPPIDARHRGNTTRGIGIAYDPAEYVPFLWTCVFTMRYSL